MIRVLTYKAEMEESVKGKQICSATLHVPLYKNTDFNSKLKRSLTNIFFEFYLVSRGFTSLGFGSVIHPTRRVFMWYVAPPIAGLVEVAESQ